MNNELIDVLNAVGAIIEISRFVYVQMIKQGFTKAQAFQTAQKIILQAMPSNKSSGSEEQT